MLVAAIVGSITFRLRGPYFVLASIAVAEIFRLAALNWKGLTNGAEGILLSDVPPLVIGRHGGDRLRLQGALLLHGARARGGRRCS